MRWAGVEAKMTEENFEEVDVLEFSLTHDEIEDLAKQLHELMETKRSFEFDIDDKNTLIINYEEE